MKNNLKLWIMLAAISIFATGCSEERSVAPIENSSPAEASSTKQTDDGTATESTESSTGEANSGL